MTDETYGGLKRLLFSSDLCKDRVLENIKVELTPVRRYCIFHVDGSEMFIRDNKW